MSNNELTVAELLLKTREFYTKRRKLWGQDKLRKDIGKSTYCLLGAMTAVATGDDKFKVGNNIHPPAKIPNRAVLVTAAGVFQRANRLPGRGRWSAITMFNDFYGRRRRDILRALRKAEQLAREEGL